MGEGMAYVDGRYCALAEAKLSVFDPGFTHSDVVYDVTSTWKGRFFRLDEHVARFLRSCKGFELTCPHSPGEIKTIVANCVQRGGVGEASFVATVLTRGRYMDNAAAQARDIFRMTPV